MSSISSSNPYLIRSSSATSPLQTATRPMMSTTTGTCNNVISAMLPDMLPGVPSSAESFASEAPRVLISSSSTKKEGSSATPSPQTALRPITSTTTRIRKSAIFVMLPDMLPGVPSSVESLVPESSQAPVSSSSTKKEGTLPSHHEIACLKPLENIRKITHPNGDIYEGLFEEDKIIKGKCSNISGAVYKGNFKDWKYHGDGLLTFPNGLTYEGQFQNGTFNGDGILKNSDGTVYYDGQFKNGVFHGSGKLTSPNGEVYDGQFLNGEYHGHGTFTLPGPNKTPDKATVYVGQFKNGECHGHGTLIIHEKTSDKKTVYVGQFQNRKYHGLGKLELPNGEVYVGNFENEKYHGLGKLELPNGKVYVGNFENGKYHGYGKLTSANGAYEGEFRAGKYHGYGKLLLPDGTVYEKGQFENDMLIERDCCCIIL